MVTAQSVQVPIFRLKTCISLFEIHTNSTCSTKLKVEHVVGLRPNDVCEFKQAGFLEGEAIGTSLPTATGRGH